MKTIVVIARIALGGIFVVFGLNAFLGFLQLPPLQGMGGAFMNALIQSGYFFPFLKSVEIACGFAIVTGIYMPLALLILLPINVNILMFHTFLGLGGLPLAISMVAIHIFLLYKYKSYYTPLFTMKSSPEV